MPAGPVHFLSHQRKSWWDEDPLPLELTEQRSPETRGHACENASDCTVLSPSGSLLSMNRPLAVRSLVLRHRWADVYTTNDGAASLESNFPQSQRIAYRPLPSVSRVMPTFQLAWRRCGLAMLEHLKRSVRYSAGVDIHRVKAWTASGRFAGAPRNVEAATSVRKRSLGQPGATIQAARKARGFGFA